MKHQIGRLYLATIGIILSITTSFAYSPFVKNYKHTDYKGASQNWDIAQSSDKKIYIGNHYGLLEFDGYNWRLYSPQNQSAVRSVYIDAKDRVYVGLDEGFGYFDKDIYGELQYTSLSDELNSNVLINKQIWSIARIGESIYFQTFSGYFKYQTNQKIIFTTTIEQLYPFQSVDNKIYIPENNNLFSFNGSTIEKQTSLAHNVRIKAVVPHYKSNNLLALTEANGIWTVKESESLRWKTDIDDELAWVIPNSATVTSDSLIVVGTILNGVYALDQDGALVWHINSRNGLQNNTVLSIDVDEENNIWLALDNGISVIHNTRFLKIKSWNTKDVGAMYDVALFDNRIYMATNQGLFVINEGATNGTATVELIPNTEGYILDLYKTSDGKLLLGHENGTYQLDRKNKLSKLSDTGGGMHIQSFDVDGEEWIFQSSYTTINIYKKEKGNWLLRNKLADFSNSIQYLEVGMNDIIWGARASKGLFKMKTDRTFNNVISTDNFKSLDSRVFAKIGVFNIKNRIVFTDQSQCYTYDDLNNEIVPYNLLNENIGHFKKARRIVQVDREHYWFITSKDAGLVSFEESIPKVVSAIYFDDYGFVMLDDFENIVSFEKGSSIVCFNNGIAQIQHSIKQKSVDSDFTLTLAWATAYNGKNETDSIKLALLPEKTLDIPYAYNSLNFGISLPVYDEKYSFRYTLEGLDEQQTSNRATIEYRRLPQGEYSLLVEAINRKGDVVQTLTYSFEINPPFYLSNWAMLFYVLLIGSIVYAIYRITKYRELSKNKKLRLKQEKEIIKLENEKLHNENTFKSKELASYAMSMIRQTEILTTLKEEIEKQKEQLGAQYPSKSYKKVMGIIDSNLSSDQEWEVFQTNFDRIHEKFFRNLRKRYPELTSSDLKLCALLRLNLDTKEIANLMNITIRGIETRRYRMRRKLELDSNESLTEFLIDFKE